MAKDRAEKKEKREKKDKRSEKDGVKKEKKEKKEKKDKTALTNAVEQELTSKVLDGIDQAEKTNGDVEVEVEQMEVDDARPVGALVPFANPLVEDKSAKKVLKSVKKGKFQSFFISLSKLPAHSTLFRKTPLARGRNRVWIRVNQVDVHYACY